jgi:hypothetical protein
MAVVIINEVGELCPVIGMALSIESRFEQTKVWFWMHSGSAISTFQERIMPMTIEPRASLATQFERMCCGNQS